MAKIILINPDYYQQIFSKSKVRAAISRGTLSLGLACVAAPLREAGHQVKIMDMNVGTHSVDDLSRELSEFRPDFVGITSTTPLIKTVYGIAAMVKDLLPETIVVAGGPHPTALPLEVLRESCIDCVVAGEGDDVMKAIIEQGLTESVPNISFKRNGQIITSPVQDSCVKDVNELLFPAYDLFDIPRYCQPKISSRKEPVGYIETSRGCYGRCVYCNKMIHGFKLRMKSYGKVVDEMERMLSIGFKELQLIDDIFTADMDRAYAVCEEILRRGLKFPWYPRGGIRVDRVNVELLKIMKRAGCYRIPFGIESGSQRILDTIKKGVKLEQAEKAVSMAKAAGLETECYFMIGLPTETEEDIEKSIAFAIKLDPDYVKFAITIPLPGTELFQIMMNNGRIKTTDWDKYNFSTPPRDIYSHDVLSWETIERYYDLSHRRFYFRPSYFLRMFFKTIKDGTFIEHVRAFFRTQW